MEDRKSFWYTLLKDSQYLFLILFRKNKKIKSLLYIVNLFVHSQIVIKQKQ